MRTKTILSMGAMMVVSASSLMAADDWENPAVFAINREMPRATALPFNDVKDAAVNDFSKSPYFMSLDHGSFI